MSSHDLGYVDPSRPSIPASIIMLDYCRYFSAGRLKIFACLKYTEPNVIKIYAQIDGLVLDSSNSIANVVE